MKKRLVLLNFVLLASIWSSIVFQSVHSFEHMVESFSVEHCLHPNDSGKLQITHQHKSFDHCYVCEFSYSNFVAPEIFDFGFFGSYRAIPYFSFVPETPHVFSASSYLLRGPPYFMT